MIHSLENTQKWIVPCDFLCESFVYHFNRNEMGMHVLYHPVNKNWILY